MFEIEHVLNENLKHFNKKSSVYVDCKFVVLMSNVCKFYCIYVKYASNY